MLPRENQGEIRGLTLPGAAEYARKFESRRAYVRFLLDWRHVLRGRLRKVFAMRYDQGLEISAIAARLGVTNGSASEYLKRARRTIMKASRRARGTVVVPLDGTQ